jgi:hypothetical protein
VHPTTLVACTEGDRQGLPERVFAPQRQLDIGLIVPARVSSIAVVCTVAISCLPKALRTISSPLESEAYRNVRSPSRGNGDRMVAVSDFSEPSSLKRKPR